MRLKLVRKPGNRKLCMLIKSEMALVLVVENTTEAEKVGCDLRIWTYASTKGEDRGLDS